ncbi:hypothetical protein [Pyxidicoccus xibeiensis]|uniref:hypothetical protein n=1 Tax=Pyxidicoccus xibeiensis TaxID=2906759 RepID=UPI0020A796BE|nr:hypothetical protein [Pyxidicoccus xibeiensis]MCP3138858.1 hypothetical protein [Pyxidicoccus xibeiensis]
MTKNILKTTLVVLAAGSMLAGCDLEQPEAPCFVQDAGNWYAKYDLVSEPRTAAGAACTVVPPIAERLGIYKFVDPEKPNEPIITIRPAGLAGLGARDSGPSTRQTATGQLATEPDADDFCSGSNFSVATVDAAVVPAVPDNPATTANEARPAVPATTITYEFSNVRVYSAPSSPGTQMTGELKYTRDGCTSTYVIRAIWPAAACIQGTTEPATNCGNGSGLNPDFAAECAPIANCGLTQRQIDDGYNGCCVASKTIPSFVDAAE